MKTAAMTKRVQAVGRKAGDRPDVPKKVLMKFEDRDTGAFKCAMVVEIADTDALRRRGLSKRASLRPNHGMWFDCRGPFWMKDVAFPLDLCYLDESGAVTEKAAMAADGGSRLYGREKYDSVQAIELPRGFCDRHGISIGDVLVPMSRIG